MIELLNTYDKERKNMMSTKLAQVVYGRNNVHSKDEIANHPDLLGSKGEGQGKSLYYT